MEPIKTDEKNPIFTKTPPDLPQAPGSWNVNRTFRALNFPVNEDGQLISIPVVVVDPSSGGVHPLAIRTVTFNAQQATYGPFVYSVPELLDLTDYAAPVYCQQRVMTTLKELDSITAAGSTTIWTPTAGKRFRLMGLIITLSKDAACAGAEIINILDGGTTIMAFNISSAALVATGNEIVIGPINFPANGYLSTAVNNLLRLNLGGALTAGSCAVNAWGCEE